MFSSMWLCVLEDFLDKGFNSDFDVVADLSDVDAIVHIRISLAFDGDQKLLVDEVHYYIGCLGIRCNDCKIISLLQKEETIAVENP